MLKINRFTLGTIFLIFTLCVNLVHTQPVFADDSTPPTETPVVVDETPTEEPVVESTPTEEPVIENTPTEEPIIDQTETEAPVSDEPEAVPSPEEEGQPAETEVNILLEELPENTSVVVLNEQGETVPLVSQEAAEIILEEDPMWCPEGVLPGGTGCTINYSSIALLMTQLNNNSANYAQNGVIYFTSANTGASFTLTSGTNTNAFNAMRNYNLTLQGGWNGQNGANATFTGQSAFQTNALTLGTAADRWVGNITISNFTFSGNSSTAVTVYTSNGDIALNNVDVSDQTGNNTALLNTTNGDILVQNGSSFDSNNSNSGGGQNGNGFSATSTNGSITITGTSANPITFQDARGPGSTTYNGATLSAPTVTLAYVTARDNDGHGIQISNANVVTLNNVISGPTASGGDGNDLSGIRVFGTGSTIVAAFGGIFADNGQYGIHVTNGSLFVSGTPNCGSGGTSNGIACYNPATPGTIPASTLNLPANMTVPATGPSGAVVNFSATATDFAGRALVVTCNPASGSTFPITTTTVNCSATNVFGTTVSGSFTVTVQPVDTTPPTLNLPSNSTHEATSAAGAVVTYSASANDAVDGPVAVTCNPASGSTFPLGPNTVTCSATDAAGNTANGSFTITVVDTGAPILNLPSNSSHEATSAAGTVVTFSASANDAVDGPVAVTCNPASGSTFPLGPNTVNCSATDAAGNSANGSFTVTVVDTGAPVLNLPSNSTHEATSAAGAVVTYSASANDAVDGPVAVTCNPASGSTFPLGPNTVTCSATDAAGNTANGSFTVTVVDTGAPVLNLPSNSSHEATSAAGAVVTYSASANDAVDGPVAVTCNPASGSTFPLGPNTVNCSATDAAGNTANGSFTITVVDTGAPILNLPSNSSHEATSAAGAVVTFSASANDAVNGPVAVTCNPASGSTFPLGPNTVNCSATDAAGNSANGSFTITVVDTTPPTLNLPGTITEQAASPAGKIVTYSASATDLVSGSVAIVCTPISGSNFEMGATVVNCSATDAAGNTANGSFTVNVVDGIAPTLSLPSNIIEEATSSAGAQVDFTVSATDVIDGDVSVTCSHNSGDAFPLGDTTVNCSASDGSGNTTNGSFMITVRDTTAPALNLPSDINEEATSASGAVVTFSLSALDIVDGDLSGSISCSSSSSDTFPFGSTIVDCSVSDAAGNDANGSFTITVADTTAPAISAQANINVVTSNPAGAVVDYVTPTTNDAVDGAGVASCAPASGSMFSVGSTLVTCSATDTNGNSASMSFNVNVTYTSPGGGGGGGTNSGGGGSSPSGGVPGLTGFIPVTGTAYAFDITCPPSKLMKQYRDFTLHFQNLCGHQGIVEILTTSTLPAPLNGQTLISAFSLSTLKGGKAAEKLPTGAEIIIDFNVPASYLNSELQILFWNGLKWVEVEGKWNGAMYEATVTYTGIFILVKE